ncbi:helix-turn-helix domain-containing protein [Ornithinibacillus californiensis]|uniref:helix-turn-helix domain-containing protein n=1 Tax=Ornithinibacillus californiensis TaxID=161536 RepID=UPI00064DF585|nr:helix-turn-helix transcriptional regulator [Ornithinibacillus californiensis]
MTIGTTVQEIRKSKGLTLSECAERANISKSYLSNIERNITKNPSVLVIQKIANVLEVDLDLILGVESSADLTLPESEWLEFVNQLKETGIDKERLGEYKTVIEFVKWQNEKLNCNS